LVQNLTAKIVFRDLFDKFLSIMANFVFKLFIATLFFFGLSNISTTNAQCFWNINTNTNQSNCGQPLNLEFTSPYGLSSNFDWSINFGDPASGAANTLTGVVVASNSALTIPTSHTYNTPGNYVVYMNIIVGSTSWYQDCIMTVNGVLNSTAWLPNSFAYHIPFYITVSSVSTSSITISGPTSVCAGSSPTFSVPVGSPNYQWQTFVNGDYYNVGTNSNTYTLTPSEVALSNPIRVITSSDNCNSCQNISADHVFEVLIAPEVSIAATNTCENNPADLVTSLSNPANTCQGLLTYAWNTGATSPNLSNLSVVAGGSYSVTVSCAGGCSTTQNFQFPSVLQQGPEIDLVSQSITCNGSTTSIVSIDIETTGGVAPFTYNWSNGETAQDITGAITLANGLAVAVTAQNGCKTVRNFSCLNPCN
jgi:hypothetical protein